ncbi:PAS domain-containing protein [Nitrospirales bacterium NOB]|nr:MAG: putative sensor histidine kinase [Nitrospira sp. OLB3]MCE7964836.1 PAS domain-containing protein [Nitrospira sp. NTP2]MDL1889385.1 PAS domain-containing protein [Nitrospirales bacterium NOB]QOJ36360.1 MAG: PAS domain-containing protein [Nitrospira sp.]RIK56150.1 MAG: hypothetical protein DCC63_18110 [Nitrospira sp.]
MSDESTIQRCARRLARLREAWQDNGVTGIRTLVRDRLWRHVARAWARFWLRFGGRSPFGRLATHLALLPSGNRTTSDHLQELAAMNPTGYIAPTATINHSDLELAPRIVIADHVRIHQAPRGGKIALGEGVYVDGHTILETGLGGSITVGASTSIGINCELSAYVGHIRIGAHVMMGSCCRMFPHNHGTASDHLIQQQPLSSKGNIVVEDDVWLGSGAILLSGVHVGKGAIVGAGSVVTKPVPPNAIAVGNPARIVKYRGMEPPRKTSPSVEFDAVMLRTPDGTIRFWNKGAERLYGWEATDTIGKRSHSLLKTLFPKPLPAIEQELKNTGRWEGELIHIRRDGSRMAVWSRWELRYDEQSSVPTILEINYPPHVA